MDIRGLFGMAMTEERAGTRNTGGDPDSGTSMCVAPSADTYPTNTRCRWRRPPPEARRDVCKRETAPHRGFLMDRIWQQGAV